MGSGGGGNAASGGGRKGAAVRDAMLVEVAWEVCNKVGGIYTVLRSKSPEMVERWKERYCLVGPYEEQWASVEFEDKRPAGRFGLLCLKLDELGVRVHHGRWLVSGNPRVLLLEHRVQADELARWKYRVWEELGVDLPAADPLLDDVVSFGRAAYLLVKTLTEIEGRARQGRRVIAHFHEWMGGLAIPFLRTNKVKCGVAFTTHATLLGRYMAGNDEWFYHRLGQADATAEATRYGVRAAHEIEKACARGTDAFTTVSPITGEECDKLLGRSPCIITPNGLNMQRFDVGHDFQMLHARYKEAIHRFVMGYFFPSYDFDLDRTLYMFTSGRFEPRNKGFDLCLEAMARLNAQLKTFDLGVTVVFFIVSNRPTRTINADVLHRRGVLTELQRVCDEVLREVGEKLFRRAAAGERVDLDTMVSQYWALRYRRTQQELRRAELPPVVTHVMEDDATDPVLNHIRSLKLFNGPDDPVKVVYHPRFISPVNPLWGIEYEQFVRGCHLGVFPSAYEPWGYTPLECVASGVPAVTSDLAGFGRYVAERLPDHDDWGLNVLRRRGRSFHDSAADLSRWLLAFCRLDRRGRIAMRNAVTARADEFDWRRLVGAYHRAHELVIERMEQAPAKQDASG
jgi:glycogen synthase